MYVCIYIQTEIYMRAHTHVCVYSYGENVLMLILLHNKFITFG